MVSTLAGYMTVEKRSGFHGQTGTAVTLLIDSFGSIKGQHCLKKAEDSGVSGPNIRFYGLGYEDY